MKSDAKGLKRILKAFVYSFDGFRAAFKESAFRQEIVVFIAGTAAAVYFPLSLEQKGMLISSLLIVLMAELTNTAIETVIDRISPEYHDLSKKAKDIGSLLVLLAFINAGVLWGLTVWQVFFQ